MNFLKHLWNLFRRPLAPLEWYCTSCGYDTFTHDDKGKLVGECPRGRSTCPLDYR